MSSLANSSINLTFYKSSDTTKTPPWIISDPEIYRVLFTVCYALILVLSVLGNTSIIAIVARNPSMRSTINYLIANMAATDLVASIVVTVRFFVVFHTLSWEWHIPGVLGSILCKFGPFVRDVSLQVSFHSIIAIGFDRFFAVVFPMRATPRLLNIRVLLPMIWLEAVLFYSVYIIRYRIVSYQGVNICYSSWPSGFDPYKSEITFTLILLILSYIIPFVIISILYSIIASHIKRQDIPGPQSQENEERRRQLNKRIVKMSFTIVMSFFTCWTPYHITVLLNLFKWRGQISSQLGIVLDIFVLVSYSSLVINPYICFIFCSNYRKSFKKLFPFFFNSRIEPLDIRGRTVSLPHSRFQCRHSGEKALRDGTESGCGGDYRTVCRLQQTEMFTLNPFRRVKNKKQNKTKKPIKKQKNV
ncbi:neuromedin-K receptor-like [Actinia tenebrosa]|uniref:Neuromedin-K receptor-like n=1 Tax=Actinia tenebrosa TaxID=6105 RepID=A0A6P8IHW9_ACTTE|nr:neuromedin-K receptor-like [Actinia tenebrosa]